MKFLVLTLSRCNSCTIFLNQSFFSTITFVKCTFHASYVTDWIFNLNFVGYSPQEMNSFTSVDLSTKLWGRFYGLAPLRREFQTPSFFIFQSFPHRFRRQKFSFGTDTTFTYIAWQVWLKIYWDEACAKFWGTNY